MAEVIPLPLEQSRNTLYPVLDLFFLPVQFFIVFTSQMNDVSFIAELYWFNHETKVMCCIFYQYMS